MPKVFFLNEAVEVEAPAGRTILEIAEQHGILLQRGMFPRLHCHGHGMCGRCRVWATSRGEGALSPLTFWERIRFYRGQRRLACQARVQGDVEVRTMPNAAPPAETTSWPEDARPSQWKERLVAKDEPTPVASPHSASPHAGEDAKPAPAKSEPPRT